MQYISRNGVCGVFLFFFHSLGFLFICLSPSRCAPSRSGTGGGSCDFSPASWKPQSPPGPRRCLWDNGAVGLCLTPLAPGPGVKGFLFPRDTAGPPLVTTGGERRRGGSGGRQCPPVPAAALPVPSAGDPVNPHLPLGIEGLRKAPDGCFGGAGGGQTSPRGRG